MTSSEPLPLWRRVWRSRPLARAAAVALALLVAWASLSPRTPHLRTFAGADKVGHAMAYLVLAGVWGHALRLGGVRRRWAALAALALATAYGGAMEGLQHFVPHRYPELLDAVANTAGAALGGALTAWAAPRDATLSGGWVTDR